mmetsp:Transcript_7844/g.8976  ORF Transcript_7844/g.8976 Transcript_7844/m.8976 type:complete len:247 (-) Transcript_7844:42-782(-)
MNKYMCHSFSFGSDARAGLSFERRRTRNRFCNRFRYAFEGVKNFIRCWGEPTLKIKQLLKNFKRVPDVIENNEPSSSDNEELKEGDNLLKDNSIIVASSKDISKSKHFLTNNPVSFYCLNLPDIMNGNINLYAGGRNRTALETEDGTRIQEQLYKKEPHFNDGILEFATFDSLLLYILNRSNSLTQGGGPFEINFNTKEDNRTYVNIDGEFYKAVNIEKIIIKKGDSLCRDGHLRVLVNEGKDIFD